MLNVHSCYDSIIVGKGPAGVSAALYTSRAGLNTLILGHENSLLERAQKIDNYYGFADTISGKFLLSQGEAQAKKLGATILNEEVMSIVDEGDFFAVKSQGNVYNAKTVLLATGRIQNKLNIDNIDKFEGNGVSYCAICDGCFYKNRKIGVIGYKNYAINEALELRAFTSDITIFTNGMPIELSNVFLQLSAKFVINNLQIKSLVGRHKLDGVILSNGDKITLDGLFIAYGSASSLNFAKELGIIMKDGYIITDNNQATNVPGLFAAGDCTNGPKQIAVAVAQGAVAGMSIIDYNRKRGDTEWG